MINTLMTLALNSPSTGDSFSPITIAVIAGAAVVAMILTSLLSKKKDD